MRSTLSNSSNSVTLQSALTALGRGSKPSKTIEALEKSGVATIEDLMWLFPLKVQKLPTLTTFDQMRVGELFKGVGKVISVQQRPSFRGRGKGGARLFDLTVILKDIFSNHTLNLKWFNTYFSLVKKIQTSPYLLVMGEMGSFSGSFQLTSPEALSLTEDELPSLSAQDGKDSGEFKVQYPTVNKISSPHIKKLIDKIPKALWNNIPDLTPQSALEKRGLMPLSTALKHMHAIDGYERDDHKAAMNRLIYQEFFEEQLKLMMRREGVQKRSAPVIDTQDKILSALTQLFPYELTEGQVSACQEIAIDLASGTPMMRLIQGDVGCGKTTVAIISCLLAAKSNYQAAFMCPTESLANQHYKTIKKIIPSDIRLALLTGSTATKEKKQIAQDLAEGKIDFVIGTHALIQESVSFKKLAVVIIDEQHKFGVDQRLKLVAKGEGAHCLIMTATPIPRSLSLTQYGDLDITTIRSQPKGQRGQKSRIVTEGTFEKFLTFINTRMELGEQVYIVVPAIQENPETDIISVMQMEKKIEAWLPHRKMITLHGALKSDEKEKALADFEARKADILLATSVIEVGIDIHNATVMAVFGPERFGLSSLHQLRGRVGRGDKPGFFFMVAEKKLSQEAIHRLGILEETTDGFKIAEEDLKIRGEGDLFGKEQSGAVTRRRVSNILLHGELLAQAREDAIQLFLSSEDSIAEIQQELAKDDRVFTTV